nr:hypothetical protein [Prescottella equi]
MGINARQVCETWRAFFVGSDRELNAGLQDEILEADAENVRDDTQLVDIEGIPAVDSAGECLLRAVKLFRER